MRRFLLVPLLVTGCAEVIEPGHRGLLFDPRHGGLQHEILNEGRHWTGMYGRLIDFDVTYAERSEQIHTISAEGLAMDLKLSISYRPVMSEIYDLDVEIGQNYYDEVVGPEFKTAARGVFSRHGYQEVQRLNEKIEDEVEAEVRRRIAGKHVEISSVRLLEVNYAPEIVNADRAKLVGEREALRKEAADKADAARRRLELQNEAEREKLQTEAELRKKDKERRLAEEQAAIDKVQAETEAAVGLTKAKAEAEEVRLMAKAHAEEKKVESVTLTPLMVMMHAYDALEKLGGSGATVMLGDFSHVPQFLFPPSMMSAMQSMSHQHAGGER